MKVKVFSNEDKIGSCQILYPLSGGYESSLTLREYYLFGNAIQGQLKIYHIHMIQIFIKTHSAQNKGKTTYSKGGHGKHGENFLPKKQFEFCGDLNSQW